MKDCFISSPKCSTNGHCLLAPSQLRNHFTWSLTVYLYLPTLQREGRKERSGGGREGRRRREMERQRKKQRTRAEPVRFDHELGVPRGTLASCILGCKYDHQREGNKLKRKKRMDRYGLASLPPPPQQLKRVSPATPS